MSGSRSLIAAGGAGLAIGAACGLFPAAPAAALGAGLLFWIVKRPAALFLFALVAALAVPASLVEIPLPKPLSDIGAGEYLLVLAFAAAAVFRPAQAADRRAGGGGALAAFLVVAALSAWLHIWRDLGDESWLRIAFQAGGFLLALGLAAVYGMGLWWARGASPAAARAPAFPVWASRVLAAAVGALVVGVTQYVMSASGTWWPGGFQAKFLISGIYPFFGVACLTSCCVGLGWAMETRGRARLLWASAAVLALWGIVLSQSRAMLIGGLAGVVAMRWARRRPVWWILPAGVLVLQVPAVIDYLAALFVPGTGNWYGSRFILWADALRMAQEGGPLGIGPGNYYRHAAVWERGILVGSPHNNYLQLLVEFGVLGVTAFLAWQWSMLRALARAAVNSPPGSLPDSPIILAAFGALVAHSVTAGFGDYLVVSATNMGLDTFGSVAPLWLLLGLAAGVARARPV